MTNNAFLDEGGVSELKHIKAHLLIEFIQLCDAAFLEGYQPLSPPVTIASLIYQQWGR